MVRRCHVCIQVAEALPVRPLFPNHAQIPAHPPKAVGLGHVPPPQLKRSGCTVTFLRTPARLRSWLTFPLVWSMPPVLGPSLCKQARRCECCNARLPVHVNATPTAPVIPLHVRSALPHLSHRKIPKMTAPCATRPLITDSQTQIRTPWKRAPHTNRATIRNTRKQYEIHRGAIRHAQAT